MKGVNLFVEIGFIYEFDLITSGRTCQMLSEAINKWSALDMFFGYPLRSSMCFVYT